MIAAIWLVLTAAAPARHDVHLSHTRLVVDDSLVVLVLRVFADDMEAALRTTSGNGSLKLATPDGDSAFVRHAASDVRVSAGAMSLRPALASASSGRDPSGYDTRSYELVYRRPAGTDPVRVFNAVLFAAFRDQQNIVVTLNARSGRRGTLYFASGDTEPLAVPR